MLRIYSRSNYRAPLSVYSEHTTPVLECPVMGVIIIFELISAKHVGPNLRYPRNISEFRLFSFLPLEFLEPTKNFDNFEIDTMHCVVRTKVTNNFSSLVQFLLSESNVTEWAIENFDRNSCFHSK